MARILMWECDEDTLLDMGNVFFHALTNPNPKDPMPVHPDNAKPWLESKGLRLIEENGEVVQHISIHISTKEHMHISLPPPELIEEARRNPSSHYPVLRGYCAMCAGTSHWTREQQYDFRFGDYTLMHCI